MVMVSMLYIESRACLPKLVLDGHRGKIISDYAYDRQISAFQSARFIEVIQDFEPVEKK
jgi:hypothetical protein